MKLGQDRLFVALCACLSDDDVTRKDAAVYACLLSHVRGYSSRPSRKRIAQEARISYVNVTRHTKRLSELGYITVTPSKGKHTNIYQLEAIRRPRKASDTGVIPATVGGVTPATVDPEAYLGFTHDTQLRAYEQQSKSKSVAGKSKQAEVGRLPPSRGANRPGANAEKLQVAESCKSESRSIACARAWHGNTDELAEQLRRDFGSQR